MEDKKYVYEELKTFADIQNYDTNHLISFVNDLKSLIEININKYTDFSLLIKKDYIPYEDDHFYYSLVLEGERYENDEEFQKRINKDSIDIIRNCPFCNTDPSSIELDIDGEEPFHRYEVVCRKCGGVGPQHVDEKVAVHLWNYGCEMKGC